MTKEEHIDYWLKSAEFDWEIVLKLFNSNDFVYSAFFAHLVLEKIAKACWVQNNQGNYPPKSHNIVYICEKANIVLDTEYFNFLTGFNDFQIEGRYPDYKFKLFLKLKKENASSLLEKVKEIREWLLKQIF
jgi:HEPN domain-containing protein